MWASDEVQEGPKAKGRELKKGNARQLHTLPVPVRFTVSASISRRTSSKSSKIY
jgi:hypothetical protein